MNELVVHVSASNMEVYVLSSEFCAPFGTTRRHMYTSHRDRDIVTSD